jgi:phosphoglucan,water dikinase
VALPSLEAFSPDAEPVIALIEKLEGDEEIPSHVVGVIVCQQTPYLSHFAIRARQGGVVLATCEEESRILDLRQKVGRLVVVDAFRGKVDVSYASTEDFETHNHNQRRGLKPVEAPAIEFSETPSILPLDRVTVSNGGAKAYGARQLLELSCYGDANFRTPPGVVIPFGVMESLICLHPSLEREYRSLFDRMVELPADALLETLEELRSIIRKIELPSLLLSELTRHFGHGSPLMVRSSSNSEDLEETAAAGLYDSVANIPADRAAEAIRAVWASLWTRRATLSRLNHAIPQDQAHMAVLIQQMVTPGLSFIMHTNNTANQKPAEVLIELAVGLGETLASAEYPGNPYRMICNRLTGNVSMLAFANFSQAVLPDAEWGVVRKTIDFSRIEASTDKLFRESLGCRLAKIGGFVEAALGCPQNIEGVVADDSVYLVQSRPQQGLA